MSAESDSKSREVQFVSHCGFGRVNGRAVSLDLNIDAGLTPRPRRYYD